MLNPYYLQKYAQMRQNEFLAEADQERLLREIENEQTTLSQRVRWRLGDWLIAVGYRLKARPQLILCENGYEGKS